MNRTSATDYSKFFFGDATDSLATYRDRLLLRLHDYQVYVGMLRHLSMIDGDRPCIELVFTLMPPEAINGLREIIGPDEAEIEFYSFKEDDNTRIGVKIWPENITKKEDK